MVCGGKHRFKVVFDFIAETAGLVDLGGQLLNPLNHSWNVFERRRQFAD